MVEDMPRVTVPNPTAFLARSCLEIGKSVVQPQYYGRQDTRSVPSILLTWGLNEDIDEVCKGRLDMVPPADVRVGYSRWFLTSMAACVCG